MADRRFELNECTLSIIEAIGDHLYGHSERSRN